MFGVADFLVKGSYRLSISLSVTFPVWVTWRVYKPTGLEALSTSFLKNYNPLAFFGELISCLKNALVNQV